jgi:hypothetical protein
MTATVDLFIAAESERLGVRISPRGTADQKLTKYTTAYLATIGQKLDTADTAAVVEALKQHFDGRRIPDYRQLRAVIELARPSMKAL